MKPQNTDKPDWWPLERSMRAAGLPIETCGAWMWMFEDADGNSYKHRDSRQYLVIDELKLFSQAFSTCGSLSADEPEARELLATGDVKPQLRERAWPTTKAEVTS